MASTRGVGGRILRGLNLGDRRRGRSAGCLSNVRNLLGAGSNRRLGLSGVKAAPLTRGIGAGTYSLILGRKLGFVS